MHIENSIVIKGDIDKVFQVMADVERWPEFLSSHRKMDIISKEGNRIMIKREGMIKWRSIITIKDRLMRSKQLEGPLRGLIAEWRFEETLEGTKMTLVHNFNYKISLGKLILEPIVARILKKIGNNTLRCVKKRVEGGLE
ncbi:MAG: SRPBCC family protein [bacterium]|nr:SRPBCC family protein [bacterium]